LRRRQTACETPTGFAIDAPSDDTLMERGGKLDIVAIRSRPVPAHVLSVTVTVAGWAELTDL
jgi:hypothetical protein